MMFRENLVSIRTPGRRAPQRSLALISAGVIIAGLAAATPAATAASAPSQSSDKVVTGNGVRYSDGRYVVLLREPSAARYDGGNAKFRATRPRAGGQFRADSASARVYTAHLRSTQAAIAREVGARPVSSYTVATNGFAAQLTGDQALRAGDRPPRAAGRKGHAAQPGHLEHPELPRAHRQERRLDDARRPAEAPAPAWSSATSTPASGPSRSRSPGEPLTSNPKTKWDIARVGTATRMEKADGGVFSGECQLGEEWTADDCNTKLIGARYYPDGFLSRSRRRTVARTSTCPPATATATAPTPPAPPPATADVTATVEGRNFGKVSRHGARRQDRRLQGLLLRQRPGHRRLLHRSIARRRSTTRSPTVSTSSTTRSPAPPTRSIDPVELAFQGAAEAGVFVSTSAGNERPGRVHRRAQQPVGDHGRRHTHHNFENTVVLGNGQKYVGASIADDAGRGRPAGRLRGRRPPPGPTPTTPGSAAPTPSTRRR